MCLFHIGKRVIILLLGWGVYPLPGPHYQRALPRVLYPALFSVFLFSAFDDHIPMGSETDLCQIEEGQSVGHNSCGVPCARGAEPFFLWLHQQLSVTGRQVWAPLGDELIITLAQRQKMAAFGVMSFCGWGCAGRFEWLLVGCYTRAVG